MICTTAVFEQNTRKVYYKSFLTTLAYISSFICKQLLRNRRQYEICLKKGRTFLMEYHGQQTHVDELYSKEK